MSVYILRFINGILSINIPALFSYIESRHL